MREEIRNRLNDQILAETRQRYGIAPDKFTELGGFESFIYGYEKGGQRYVLRLGHSQRRSPDLIRGEVDWINHLARGGAGVARAVNSQNDNLVELIPDGAGDHFLATAFAWADGDFVWKMGGWTEQFMLDYGRLLGKIHTLTKQYVLPNPAWKRPEWDDPSMTDTSDDLPRIDPPAAEKLASLLAYLRTLPRDPDSYGMIHQDAHSGNLFVNENGQITLFDFDDCAYGHFIYDIAMVLFYAVVNRPNAVEFMHQMWPNFWRGYQEENRLEPVWLAEIPHFMKMRELDLYTVLLRDIPDLASDRWASDYMAGRRENILAERPYIDFNFEEILFRAEESDA